MAHKSVHRQIYRKCFDLLINTVHLETLLPKLLSNDILDPRDYEKIKRRLEREGPTAAAEELFTTNLLRNPDPQSFYILREALNESGQQVLVERMQEECIKLTGKRYEELFPENPHNYPGINWLSPEGSHTPQKPMQEVGHYDPQSTSTVKKPIQEATGDSYTTHSPVEETGSHVTTQYVTMQSVSNYEAPQGSTTLPVTNVQDERVTVYVSSSSDIDQGIQSIEGEQSVESMDCNETEVKQIHSSTEEPSSGGTGPSLGSNSPRLTGPSAQRPLAPAATPMEGSSGFGPSTESHQSASPADFIPQIDPKELNLNRNNKIGSGSFGVVYKCKWKGTVVAVKEMNIPLRRRKDKYTREIDIIARIRHPNIVQLMAVALEKGAILIVYEYIPGETLESILFDEETTKKYKLTSRNKCEIGKQITQAVAYLHEASPQIIHGDVKPANVIITGVTYMTKLCDMGVSRVKDRYAHNTTGGTRGAGTPFYMAPEQLVEEKSITAKTDVYCCGATLFELFAGVELWDFGDINEGKMIMEIKDFMKRKELTPQLEKLEDGDVKTVIVQCMAHDEDMRPRALQLTAWMDQLCEVGSIKDWKM